MSVASTPPEFPRHFIVEVVLADGSVHFALSEAVLAVKAEALPAGVKDGLYAAIEAQRLRYSGPLTAAPPALHIMSSDSGGNPNFKMFQMSTLAVSKLPDP